jgi:hypothetical protein
VAFQDVGKGFRRKLIALGSVSHDALSLTAFPTPHGRTLRDS